MNQGLTLTSSTSFFPLAEIHSFSAKERDVETGLSYFGSRYYSSDLSVWLSVDPMSDKYPSLSPYVYCADNPVKLVDPNGEKVLNAFEELRNSTESAYKAAEIKLQNLQKGSFEFKNAKKEYKIAKKEMKKVCGNYNVVAMAINDVKRYNKELYNKLDNLKDEQGQDVDVYVTFNESLRSNYEKTGYAILSQIGNHFSANDIDSRICSQENAVIAVFNPGYFNKGKALSHELGHIGYEVPNWTHYHEWRRKTGHDYDGYEGHDDEDESGNAAMQAENDYTKNRGY